MNAKAEVKKLLPCHCTAPANERTTLPERSIRSIGGHHPHCVGNYHNAVTSALEARDNEIARLVELDKVSAKAHNQNLLELEDIRVQITELVQQRMTLLNDRAARDKEIAKLKDDLQRMAGFKPHRCVCVFENDETDPISECAYHEGMRAKIARLKAGHQIR